MCPDGELAQVVLDRLDRELGVINKLGFANYFLICWDFVVQARKRNIPATARGSGVGAIVCYALYLSHVCPIKYGLLFERFLDENRLEAPDIDIDFCKESRGEIIRYVKEKYGEECVAQIGTFGTMAAKAALKDVGRVLSIPLARVNQITGMIPDQLGIKLADALKKSAELANTYENDPEIREMIDFALKLEGLAPKRRHSCGSGGHRRQAAERVCSAYSCDRQGRRDYSVVHERCRSGWSAEDGLPGFAKPDDSGARGRCD